MAADPNQPAPVEDPLRPHTYDGIREYDKRLPNWWLFTLYGSIVFSIIYWLYYHVTGVGLSEHAAYKQEMDALQAARLASAVGNLTDVQLWEMSRNAQLVAAGKATFTTNCIPCHLASLRGKEENPAAVGPSLVDSVWIHGGRPSEVRTTITKGVPEKGMQTWGPILGDKKIVELVAFVMSHHQPPAAAP